MEGPKVPSDVRRREAPRGWCLGRGAVKNQRWNCTFSFGFSNVWRVTPVAKQSSVCNSGAKIFFNPWRGGHSPMSPFLATPLYDFKAKIWPPWVDSYLNPSIHPYLNEHSCQISSRSDLKRRRLSLFWRGCPPLITARTTRLVAVSLSINIIL